MAAISHVIEATNTQSEENFLYTVTDIKDRYSSSADALKKTTEMVQHILKHELPDVQAGFRKGRGTRDQIANIHWIMKKAREFQKKHVSALLTMPKPLTVWITISCGKF